MAEWMQSSKRLHLPRTPRLKRYKNYFYIFKPCKKCLRQVSWLSGRCTLPAFPRQ